MAGQQIFPPEQWLFTCQHCRMCESADDVVYSNNQNAFTITTDIAPRRCGSIQFVFNNTGLARSAFRLTMTRSGVNTSKVKTWITAIPDAAERGFFSIYANPLTASTMTFYVDNTHGELNGQQLSVWWELLDVGTLPLNVYVA